MLWESLRFKGPGSEAGEPYVSFPSGPLGGTGFGTFIQCGTLWQAECVHLSGSDVATSADMGAETDQGLCHEEFSPGLAGT